MKHYEDSEWVDFARGMTRGERRAEMEDHLSSGCSDCARAAASFERIASLARCEAESEPPHWVLRNVYAYFSLQQVGREASLLEKLELHLAFDSLADGAVAGTRSLDSASRQVVYYGHDYALTLRMDYDSEVSLGGELLHRKSGPVPNVPALLMSGHSVLGYSLSGELGDFQMSCEKDQPIRLRMLVNDDELIEIDLDWAA